MRISTYASIITVGAMFIHFHNTAWIAAIIAAIAGVVEDRR
jgi:hypothetical protein